MFKKLRKKIVIQVTLWFLVITFVIWGAGSTFQSRKNYAGILFGKRISVQEYNRNYAAVFNRARMLYGDNLSQMEKFLNLKEQAWDRLTLLIEGKRRLIHTSNKEVIDRIALYKFFQRNGVFNKQLYTYIVEDIFQTTPRDFEESVRDDIVIEKLMEKITKEIAVSDSDARQAYREQNELVDLSFLVIQSQGYKKSVSVSDDELPVFYEKNKEKFRSMASVNVDYLKIPFTAEGKQDAQAKAEEIEAFFKTGKGLKAAAKQYTIALKETGFFSINSNIPEIGLSYPFALTAFKLQMNQISEIVETGDAFYLMQLKAKKPPEVLAFEKAKDRVKDALITEKASSLAMAEAQGIVAQIKNEAKGLEDVASALNKTVLTAKGVSRKSYVKEIGSSDSFMSIAFTLAPKEISAPIPFSRGYAIVRLDELKPIDEEAFKKDELSFKETLIEKTKQEKFQEWFQTLKAKAGLKDNL